MPLGVAVPAMLAATIAGYLLVVSLSASARPAGCGVGSGCDEVLSSRWSKVLGIPVGLPAIGLYLLVAVAAVVTVRSKIPRKVGNASIIFWSAGGAIVAAVSWFVGLQWIELRAFCSWCLTDHALGLIAVLAALLYELQQRRFRPGSFLVGMGLTALLAATQIFVPGPGPTAQPLTSQQLVFLEGQLSIDRGEIPQLGTALGGSPVVVLFDYCCPHCRQTHEHLLEIQSRHPGRLALILLPVPLNMDCNPHVEETERRFQSACDLARLSLAVWRVDRKQFAEFDRWLFESEQPRTADKARLEAGRLVSPAALDAALDDPWVKSRIRANVDAFQASGIESIPVLLAPGQGGVSGRVADAEALVTLLRNELKIAIE